VSHSLEKDCPGIIAARVAAVDGISGQLLLVEDQLNSTTHPLQALREGLTLAQRLVLVAVQRLVFVVAYLFYCDLQFTNYIWVENRWLMMILIIKLQNCE